jgi:hypothetical protein
MDETLCVDKESDRSFSTSTCTRTTLVQRLRLSIHLVPPEMEWFEKV